MAAKKDPLSHLRNMSISLTDHCNDRGLHPPSSLRNQLSNRVRHVCNSIGRLDIMQLPFTLSLAHKLPTKDTIYREISSSLQEMGIFQSKTKTNLRRDTYWTSCKDGINLKVTKGHGIVNLQDTSTRTMHRLSNKILL